MCMTLCELKITKYLTSVLAHQLIIFYIIQMNIL